MKTMKIDAEVLKELRHRQIDRDFTVVGDTVVELLADEHKAQAEIKRLLVQRKDLFELARKYCENGKLDELIDRWFDIEDGKGII